MPTTNVYTIKKYNGDDQYSWAVFYKDDVRGIRGNVVFAGQAKPIISGESKRSAEWHRNKLEASRPMCKWYLNCDHKAVTTQEHPILGQVPICRRCQRRYENLEMKTGKITSNEIL
jgi:hypothetical protein